MKMKNDIVGSRRKRTKEIAAENKGGHLTELPESEQIVFLPFSCNQEWYALEVQFLKEVIKAAPITIVPETPDFLMGVINLRGEIISVFDLATYFSQGSIKETFTRILIIRHQKTTFGILSSENTEVSRVPNKILQSPLSMVDSEKRESIKGIFSYQGKMISLLDIPGIFLSPKMDSFNW